MTSLSVLVPVYNEQHLVATSLARLEVLETSPHLERIQVVVVDDCSRDQTGEVLKAFAAERGIAWQPNGPIEHGVELRLPRHHLDLLHHARRRWRLPQGQRPWARRGRGSRRAASRRFPRRGPCGEGVGPALQVVHTMDTPCHLRLRV